MPREKRNPPWGLSRFNYWNYSGIAPQESDEVHTFSPTWANEHSHHLSKEQFSVHVAGRRCGVAGCQLDDKLIRIKDQKRRRFLALRRYVGTDRLWQQDPTTQTVLKGLRQCEREEVRALEQSIRGQIKRRDWFRLLKDIARDQTIFEEIIAQKSSSAEDLEEIGQRYDLTEHQMRDIYRAYSRQRQRLLGNITSRDVRRVLTAKGMSLAPLNRPIIPRTKPVEDDKPRPMFDRSGTLIDYDQCGEEIDRDKAVDRERGFQYAGHSRSRRVIAEGSCSASPL